MTCGMVGVLFLSFSHWDGKEPPDVFYLSIQSGPPAVFVNMTFQSNRFVRSFGNSKLLYFFPFFLLLVLLLLLLLLDIFQMHRLSAVPLSER